MLLTWKGWGRCGQRRSLGKAGWKAKAPGGQEGPEDWAEGRGVQSTQKLGLPPQLGAKQAWQEQEERGAGLGEGDWGGREAGDGCRCSLRTPGWGQSYLPSGLGS